MSEPVFLRLLIPSGPIWSETEEIPVWAEVAKLPEAERKAIIEKYMAKMAERALGNISRFVARYHGHDAEESP